jgi:hypothetical protein
MIEDFLCFITRFAEGIALPHEEQIAHDANCDGSTTPPVLNAEDFTCFVAEFASGSRSGWADHHITGCRCAWRSQRLSWPPLHSRGIEEGLPSKAQIELAGLGRVEVVGGDLLSFGFDDRERGIIAQ